MEVVVWPDSLRVAHLVQYSELLELVDECRLAEGNAGAAADIRQVLPDRTQHAAEVPYRMG